MCLYSPFHLSEVHHFIDGAGLTHHVEPPQACVCVAGVEGLEAVAQVPLTGHLSQFTGQILGSQTTESSRRGYELHYHVQIAVRAMKVIRCLV